MGEGANAARKTRSDLADDLVALIVASGLAPGDRLPPEIEIARRLGVSRGKLREALTAWSQMGLVSRNRGGGTVLTAPIAARTMTIPLAISLEAESLLWMLAVRRPLEIEAARLAATAATPLDRGRIVARMLDLTTAYERGEDWRPADNALHAAIHDATGNPLFGQLIGQLQRTFEKVYAAPFGMPQLGSETVPLHRDLAEAIAAGDPAAAAAAMMAILDGTEAAARAVIEALE